MPRSLPLNIRLSSEFLLNLILSNNLDLSYPGGYYISMTAHILHPEIIKRLKRAQGHLKSIIEMLENDRECIEIVQQMQAVEKAITNAKKTFVHDHIDHCLELVLNKGSQNVGKTIREFKDITKYL